MQFGTLTKGNLCWTAATILVFGVNIVSAQQTLPPEQQSPSPFSVVLAETRLSEPQTLPLYGDAPIPNSRPTTDREIDEGGSASNVTRPTIQVFLPAKAKANGAGVLVFPGGGYSGLAIEREGVWIAQFLQDHGTAAFVVKYRLPSDATMEDKSIGPLQDAQQAIRLVRQHAQEWKLDPARIGVWGFSAGGHLAATLGTHFDKAYIPNPDGVNLRPDFMILVYPVITMDPVVGHAGTRKALLGDNPTDDQVKLFSNELQVTNRTPPALIVLAADDHLVDADNSIRFFEALRHHEVPVDMTIFHKGDHGLFLLTRDTWLEIIARWMERNFGSE